MTKRLTKEQAQQIEKEMNALHGDGQKQLQEWKEAMVKAAMAIRCVSDTHHSLVDLKLQLREWIEQIKLQVIRVEGSEAVTVYDFPDGLVEWLEQQHPDLIVPAVLVDCLNGSVQTEAKPIVSQERPS